MASVRRSLLQVKILIQLTKNPARTLSELSDRVNAKRPSVSRSIHTLKAQGLVKRIKKGWILTEEGKIQTAQAQEKLANDMERLKSATVRSTEVYQQIASSIGPVMNSLVWPKIQLTSLAAAFNEASHFSLNEISETVGSTLSQYQEIGKWSSIFLSTNFYEQALKPLLEIQDRNRLLIDEMIIRTSTPNGSSS